MSIRWSDRSASSNWLLTKIDCLLIRSDEKKSDFVVNSIINSEVQIKTLNIKSDVENVVSNVEDWSYSLKFDDVVAVICFCKDSSDKNSKSKIRMLF